MIPSWVAKQIEDMILTMNRNAATRKLVFESDAINITMYRVGQNVMRIDIKNG